MKKHIVLINTWRTISSVGGTEKVLCDMANALTEHSYNVTIICFETKKGQPAFPPLIKRLDSSMFLINFR